MSAPTYSADFLSRGGFVARFPELATSDTDTRTWITNRLDDAWDWAAGYGGTSPKRRLEASLLMVAHQYALERLVACDGRMLASEGVEEAGRSYYSLPVAEGLLAQTKYGQSLSLLEKMSSGRLPIVGGYRRRRR